MKGDRKHMKILSEQIKDLSRSIKCFKDDSKCLEINNYPKNWVDDIIRKQKEIFKKYSKRDERVEEIDKVRLEYHNKFVKENMEVKIPFNNSLYTLDEANELLSNLKKAYKEESDYNNIKV